MSPQFWEWRGNRKEPAVSPRQLEPAVSPTFPGFRELRERAVSPCNLEPAVSPQFKTAVSPMFESLGNVLCPPTIAALLACCVPRLVWPLNTAAALAG